MKHGVRLGLTLVGAYLIFLCVTVPAPVVLDKLSPQLAPLALYNVSGTLWSGHAATLGYDALRVTNVAWSTQPFALLLGHAEIRCALDDPALHGTVTLGRTLGGGMYLTDAHIQAALHALQAGGLLKILPPLNGQVEFALSTLRYSGGKLSAADGTIDIKGVAAQTPQLTLGDFHIDLATQQAGIKATLSDRGGALRGQGVAMITPDGAYQFTGSFSARDAAEKNLQQYLRMMGNPSSDGRVNVNYSGHL